MKEKYPYQLFQMSAVFHQQENQHLLDLDKLAVN